MITTFPNYAQLEFTSNEYKPQVAVQRSAFEDGSVRQGTILSRSLVQRSLTYVLCSAANFQSFKNWVRDDLNRGTRWFMWDDPIKQRLGEVNSLIRVRIVEGKTEYSAFEETMNIWKVSFTIEHWDTV